MLGDIAVLHLRFGHNQHSFTWSETAVVLGLVLLPSPWLPIVAPLSVALAHLVARRPLVKVAFNSMSFAVGVYLARLVTMAVGAGAALHHPTGPHTWAALAAASLVFFLWNGLTVSLAVSLSQGLRLVRVYREGLRLNVLVWLGNTATGVLLVAMGASQPATLG